MASYRARSLLRRRRLKQAILGGLVGCIVALCGYSQLGEVIRNGTAQNVVVSYPSMATESVDKFDFTEKIESEGPSFEAFNFSGGYRPRSAPLDFLGVGTPRPECGEGISILKSKGGGRREGLCKRVMKNAICTTMEKSIGGRQSSVFNSYLCLRAVGTFEAFYSRPLKKYIGPQLPLLSIADGIGLIPRRVGESTSSLDGFLSIVASVPHLNQLTSHRIPLEQRSEERQYSYAGYYSGPYDELAGDAREAPRFPYERIGLGTCVIGLGWICLWFSFESFEKLSKSPRYMAGGIILGLIAIALIGHGLFYACLGVWGLPSLYVL
jgi:hypothetical protein